MTQSLSQGDGPLYADPSANRAREFFRNKPRALVDKLTTVKDAVARLVCDGDYLAVGGFGGDRFASAVCHEIVRQKKQNLTLAGHTTPASVRWEARASEPPLAGHVEITGYVDEARRIELFADACMLVLPSYEEGFGLPVLEAMACGVPVVISSRGSLPEVAGPAADPVEPDDADGLTSRMLALLDDDTAREASRKGLAQAAHYSWRACAAAARGAYRAAREVHAGRR